MTEGRVKVEFPDGVREIEPDSWSNEDPMRPARPNFHSSQYTIFETVCGQHIAIQTGQEVE